MNTKTALVARSCRLHEWANMIQECKNRPADMSVKQWCDEHSITVANYYYRMTEVRKACLSAVPAEVVEQAIVPVPKEVMTSPESGSGSSTDTSHTLDLVCGKITIHVNEQTSMELLSKVLEVTSHVE